MPHETLFKSMYLLTEALKGAPLKNYEKKALMEEFYQASGNAFDKAKNAIARVLHGDVSYIYDKIEIYDDLKVLLHDIKQECLAGFPK